MNNLFYNLTLPCETSHRPFGEGFMELFINYNKNSFLLIKIVLL
jgi:hypothetical protein